MTATDLAKLCKAASHHRIAWVKDRSSIYRVSSVSSERIDFTNDTFIAPRNCQLQEFYILKPIKNYP